MTNEEMAQMVNQLVLANLSIQRTSLSARRKAARNYSMNTDLQLEANLLDAQIAALDILFKNLLDQRRRKVMASMKMRASARERLKSALNTTKPNMERVTNFSQLLMAKNTVFQIRNLETGRGFKYRLNTNQSNPGMRFVSVLDPDVRTGYAFRYIGIIVDGRFRTTQRSTFPSEVQTVGFRWLWNRLLSGRPLKKTVEIHKERR